MEFMIGDIGEVIYGGDEEVEITRYSGHGLCEIHISVIHRQHIALVGASTQGFTESSKVTIESPAIWRDRQPLPIEYIIGVYSYSAS